MNIENDIKTFYLLKENENYQERLYEAYIYLKAEGINSLEDFKTREGLKIGAFTYDEITIFDRLTDVKYKELLLNSLDNVTEETKKTAKNPKYGDELASWGTLGYTPNREQLINNGYIIEGLTEEEKNRRFR